MNLKSKTNDNLITHVKNLLAEDRERLIEMLHYLREIAERKLYLERGYPSLFAFMTEELGFSEGVAQRRIQAMRLMKEVPRVEEKIESGKLSLMVAAQVQGFIKQEEKRKSISNIEKLELVEKLQGTSSRVCEKQLMTMAPQALPREKTKVLTEENTLIQFVANKNLMKKIEKLKSLLSHQNSDQRYDRLFERVIDMALTKLDPEIRKQKKSPPALAVEKRTKTRHIPQATRNEIWIRDQGRCQYQNRATGKICNSQYMLQIDHIHPYSLGGGHEPENLQLLCGAHNRLKSEIITSG